MLHTDIENLTDKDFSFSMNDTDPVLMLTDLSVPVEHRINGLNLFYNENKDETLEVLNKLVSMYEFSGLKLLKEYLFDISEKSMISPFLKSISAKGLYNYDKDDISYKAINTVYCLFGPDISTTYKIEFIKILMENLNYKDEACSYFCAIIDNTSLDYEFRFKYILGLDEKFKYFKIEAFIIFSKNTKNYTKYRILACQNILRYNEKAVSETIEILFSFSNDKLLDYDLRADATDVVLQYGTGDVLARAQSIIMDLGFGGKRVKTMYQNAQNVHTKEIEESVMEGLEFLQSFIILKHKGHQIDISYMENILKDLCKDNLQIDQEKIKVSLNRIIMDRALYSIYSCSLENILLRVWTYIDSHDCRKEMEKRLLEELVEMAGTCSSGFATRLINTISGFGDFNMKISWRDQIISNFTGRLNARARDMDDLKLQEKVLEQMTLSTMDYESRAHFLKFMRNNILEIRDELYGEFRDHITDTDFDLYFRAAISMYETGNYN